VFHGISGKAFQFNMETTKTNKQLKKLIHKDFKIQKGKVLTLHKPLIVEEKRNVKGNREHLNRYL
jgi:hypothetical protein